MTESERTRLYKTVGERVRDARERIPLTQAALADKLKISRASVVNIEKGRQRPPLHVLWAIAEKLGIEVVDLIPRQKELTEDTPTVELDASILNELEEAAEGDPATLRYLTEFVQKAKSETRSPS